MRRLAAAAVGAGLVAVGAWLLVPGRPPPESGGIRVLRGGTEVELSGPLSPEMAAALRGVRSARVVQLDSAGGSASGAAAVAEAIRLAGQDTAVTDRCLSVCVVAFMAGRRRWVGPFARIGLEAALVPSYRSEGLREAIIHEAALTPPGQAWFPEPAEMVQAGLATDQAAPDQFALGGFGPHPTPTSIRDRLLTVPLYRALSVADPAGFDATLGLWIATIREGRPGTAAFADTQALLAHTFAAALPLAPDPLLLTHAALFRDELAWMLQHDPAACARWAAAQGGLPGPTDPDLVSRRRALELAVLTAARPSSPAGPERPADCPTLARQWAQAMSADVRRHQ